MSRNLGSTEPEGNFVTNTVRARLSHLIPKSPEKSTCMQLCVYARLFLQQQIPASIRMPLEKRTRVTLQKLTFRKPFRAAGAWYKCLRALVDLYFQLEIPQHNKQTKLTFSLENLNYLSVNAVNSEHLSIKSFSNCSERRRKWL